MVAVRETKPHQIPKPQGTLEKLKTKIIERKSIRSGKSQIIERKKQISQDHLNLQPTTSHSIYMEKRPCSTTAFFQSTWL